MSEIENPNKNLFSIICEEEKYINLFLENQKLCIFYKKLCGSLEIINTIYRNGGDNYKPRGKFKDYFDENKDYRKNFEKFTDDNNFECHDYGNILFGWMKVLSMLYFCLFLITISLAGVEMMFYACLKRQGYLITILHVLWNIIRFFMFSFFIFGAACGIFDLVLKDSILVIKHLFNNSGNSEIIKDLIQPNEFLENCIQKEESDPQREHNFAKEIIDKQLISELQNFYCALKEIMEEEKTDTICGYLNDEECKGLSSYAYEYAKEGGILGFFDCGFLENDLNMTYRAIYDISKESKILSALSLTSSFFGAIAVYFYLLVMHHYNNELFSEDLMVLEEDIKRKIEIKIQLIKKENLGLK